MCEIVAVGPTGESQSSKSTKSSFVVLVYSTWQYVRMTTTNHNKSTRIIRNSCWVMAESFQQRALDAGRSVRSHRRFSHSRNHSPAVNIIKMLIRVDLG